MQERSQLLRILQRIDGAGYKAYQRIKGSYDFGHYSLSVDHVQGDPFASPSRMSVQIELGKTGLPQELHSNRIRRLALSDFLARTFAASIRTIAQGRRGTGHSGAFRIDSGKQEVLERNSVVIGATEVEARFEVGLPAGGRRILGRKAESMLLGELPQIVDQSMLAGNLPLDLIQHHLEVIEDQETLREQLAERNLVAFVADGSILPPPQWNR